HFITIYPSPVADFRATPDYNISISDPEVQLINQSTVLNNNTYAWVIDNYYTPHTTDAAYTFTAPGSYYVTLTATNEFGCVAEVTKLISVSNEFGFWIPNAFTPNDDDRNDVFRPVASPYGLDFSTYEMMIFDRWGECVFTTKDFATGWNGARFNKGEIMKADVYVYKVIYKDADSNFYSKTGHVTLIK
ncbi:MAG: T9SS type B sorting domain-containing protein, partial [Bacteroidia bacterium]